ncbi:MAG: hypothetical protein HN366_10860 [Deltaproteobacteria bacterium]|nr:hypothetical protein [Deltaproteobacteria bacterium]
MKPTELCTQRFDTSETNNEKRAHAKLKEEKSRIERLIGALGFTLRLGRHEDIWNIHERTCESFSKEAAQGISPYDLYRFIHHGYPALVLDGDGKVLAYDLSISYDDAEKTSYEVAVAVDHRLSGHRLGALLSTYGAILGWERGSRVRKSTVHPLNTPSVKNLLNYAGFYVADFIPNFLGQMGPRLLLSLRLTPNNILNQAVSMGAVKQFVTSGKQNTTYRLIRCSAFGEIDQMYRETRFRIIAFIPGSVFDDEPLFLACLL